ncbi:hypothetical protein V8C86DRAFT_2658701 [Haematococcus lacustris]
MGIRALTLGGGQWPVNPHWRQLGRARQRRSQQTQASSASGTNSSGRGSYFERVSGWQGPWKAALTSASLSATGDLLSQFVQYQLNTGEAQRYDPARTLRMFGFGLCIYGPLQFYWYNWLEWMLPMKTTASFLAKVTANQLMLAPVTLSSVFAWNLTLSGRAGQVADKIKDDLVPTMMNGWKFWIPAASINFRVVPLEQQVLYMSACGVLWTAYLSHASVTHIKQA